MNESATARAYHAWPLAGSPAGRLRDDVARVLASGLVRRCPHPDQPAFWFLPAGILACASCTGELAGGAGTAACQACGEPGSAIAAWVTGGVACVAPLCEGCHSDGLVPAAPN